MNGRFWKTCTRSGATAGNVLGVIHHRVEAEPFNIVLGTLHAL